MAPLLFSFKHIYVEWVITKEDSIKPGATTLHMQSSRSKTLHQEVSLGMLTASSFSLDTE